MKNLLFLFILIISIWFNPVMAEKGKIIIVVSVDWEGRILERDNLEAMKNFRKEFPHINMQHFLNAAYFTKPDAVADEVADKMKSVLIEGDEQGLHIHGWKRLFEESGVKYRAYPKWTPKEYHDSSETQCYYDCGHEVPISAYTTEELRKVIRKSISILSENGFSRPESFRAGGWVAAPNVIEALFQEGIKLDASALPLKHLEGKLEGYKIKEWLLEIWGNLSVTTQPFDIGEENHKIMEFPDNGCLADYMEGDDMLKVFRELSVLLKNNPEEDLYLSIGFHQETASRYLHRLKEAVKLIKKEAEKYNTPYSYASFPLFPSN